MPLPFPSKLLSMALLLALAPSLRAQSPVYVNAQVTFHQPVLDPQGNLLAWYEPEKSLGYDQVMRLNFKPVRVTAGQAALLERKNLQEPGYTVEAMQGDYIVRLRHTGSPDIVVEEK